METHRRKTCENTRRKQQSASQCERPRKKPVWQTPWSWISSFQKDENMHCHCLSHSFWVLCYGSPSKLIQRVLKLVRDGLSQEHLCNWHSVQEWSLHKLGPCALQAKGPAQVSYVHSLKQQASLLFNYSYNFFIPGWPFFIKEPSWEVDACLSTRQLNYRNNLFS